MRLLKAFAASASLLCTLSACVAPGFSGRQGNALELEDFLAGNPDCFDRQSQPYTAVVDSHLHFRPFGGAPIPFEHMLDILRSNGVLFANMYGIGQSLPINGPCEYYLDCIGTPATPSLKNDFANAQSLMDHKPKDIHLTLSMTFPDLSRPEETLRGMSLLDREYPGQFKWMGEVNLVKQALFGNGHRSTPLQAIANWAPFMRELARRDIPLAIHADIGSNAEPTRYLSLMQEVVRRYPNNRIIWMHLGLSKELTTMSADDHIRIVSTLLDRHPKLMADLSWRVLYDVAFSKPGAREKYVRFINRYSDRLLPGTDFVALWRKADDVYAEELRVTSDIFRDIDDEAFRKIALGQNYFDLLRLRYRAPAICKGNPQAAQDTGER